MSKPKASARTLPRTGTKIDVLCQSKPDSPGATAATAAPVATGRLGVSTQPDPERSGAVEIATRKLGAMYPYPYAYR